MTTLHATPYNRDAAGFYFTDALDYETKATMHVDRYGNLVEEFEIQFIDGDDAALFEACTQGRSLYLTETQKEPPAGFLEDLRFHDLRHESTSRFFETGKLDIMEIASITGHKTLQMLKRYPTVKWESVGEL